ncbi:MAG TPA: sugar transferase [Rubrivivax sp.]|nr:sugar transferase [Rubrivivax sp.]
MSKNHTLTPSNLADMTARDSAAAAAPQRPADARARLRRLFRSSSPRLDSGAARASAPPTARSHLEQTLPLEAFLTDLHREKRRAERSHAPLSMVLYRIGGASTESARQAEQLVEVLHREKRVTDFIGHVGDDMVAVLCPDTDAVGVKGFMRKIESKADALPFAAVAATYPDDLFDRIANGTPTVRTVQPFMAAEATDEPDRAYPLKRMLDISGALVALCLLAPLMAVVAFAVAVSSRGPVIFKQTRVGKGGFPFTFYKFRSMRTDADDRLHRDFVTNLIKAGDAAASADDSAATFKIKSDPRFTPVGRFIRKTSIDELPQLFNVLKGDMSLVGPRPPIPYEAATYQAWHLRRVLSVKPGMTGLWQVEGRSRVPFNEMVRMDLRYIRNCSFGLDLLILAKTVPAVLSCDGAD